MDANKAAVLDQVKTAEQAVQTDVSALKDRIAADEKTNTDLQGDLKVVTDKLKITQGQLKKARQEAAELNSTTAETKDKLTALDTSVHTELATKATTDDVKTVDTKVTQVNSDLNKTIADLNMAKSELGTLIARNHDEIDVLRRKGERDYVEFSIAGKNQPQKVGNLTVESQGHQREAEPRQLVVTVEDKKYEDKNRQTNHTVDFLHHRIASAGRVGNQPGGQEPDQRLPERPKA